VANKQSTTRDRVAKHVVVTPLLKALYEELKELAKKKPDAAVSKTKIKIVNRLLEKCQGVLADEPELEFLDLLDAEGTIAQASDAVLMIGQFVSAMDTFSTRYCRRFQGSYSPFWFVENGERLSEDGTDLPGKTRAAANKAETEAEVEYEDEEDDDEDDE
jgi:hypothetical protein